jgi:hypothetical protein
MTDGERAIARALEPSLAVIAAGFLERRLTLEERDHIRRWSECMVQKRHVRAALELYACERCG